MPDETLAANGNYGGHNLVENGPMARVVPAMDAVVKVFCVHTDPNFSLPWQRKRQYSSSSSGFVIGGRRVLTNAHSVEHYTQVKLKKRGSDTKYVATVLAIGTECDIGEDYNVWFIVWDIGRIFCDYHFLRYVFCANSHSIKQIIVFLFTADIFVESHFFEVNVCLF